LLLPPLPSDLPVLPCLHHIDETFLPDGNKLGPAFLEGGNLVLLMLVKLFHPDRLLPIFVELYIPYFGHSLSFLESSVHYLDLAMFLLLEDVLETFLGIVDVDLVVHREGGGDLNIFLKFCFSRLIKDLNINQRVQLTLSDALHLTTLRCLGLTLIQSLHL
jgi:hypothetical protein